MAKNNIHAIQIQYMALLIFNVLPCVDKCSSMALSFPLLHDITVLQMLC